MKNFYLITINPEQIFYPEVIKNAITKDSSIDAWWNHVSNTYIIRTTETAQYHSNRLLNIFPGLSFFIVKVDLNEYNGYLPQVAWDWIAAHSLPKPTYKTFSNKPMLIKAKTSIDPSGSNYTVEHLKAALKQLQESEKK